MNAAIDASQDTGESEKGEPTTLDAVSAPEKMRDAVMFSATGTAGRSAALAAADPADLAGDSAKAADECSTPAI